MDRVSPREIVLGPALAALVGLIFSFPLLAIRPLSSNPPPEPSVHAATAAPLTMDPFGPEDPLVTYEHWALDQGMVLEGPWPPEVTSARDLWLSLHPIVPRGKFRAPAQGLCAPDSPSCAPPNPPTSLAVSNLLSSVCALYLTWSPGSSNCSKPITYVIYRDVTNPFTPGPSNQIATGVADTVYEDSAGLSSSVTYYYIVHAYDSNGGEESNTNVAGGSPGATLGTVAEGFEPGGSFQNPGWTIQTLSSPGSHPDPNPWMGSQPGSYLYDGYTGTGVRYDLDWPIGSYPAYPNPGSDPGGVRALVSPMWHISSSSVLTFWHTWSFENNYTPQDGYTPAYNCHDCYDGAVLEYKRPGDASWTRITGAQILGATYNGAIDAYSNTDNPLGRNVPAWVGGTGPYSTDPTAPPTQAYAQATVAIGSLAGSGDVQVRWLQSGDTGNAGGGYIGWYLDDVEVTDVILSGTCTPSPSCTAPGAPTLTCTTVCGVVGLSWSPGSGTANSYNVYRSVFSGSQYQRINAAPVTGTTYSDITAVQNTTYYYVVRGACDAFGLNESANSNECSATSGGSSPPAAPGAPSFSAVGSTALTVSWSPVAGATAYDLYRFSGTCPSAGSLLAPGLTSPTYVDSGLSPSSTYGYYAVAESGCGSSGNGGCASVTTQAPPPWTPSGTTIGTTAMTAVKSAPDGGTFDVSWDNTCAPTNYEIVYGTSDLLPTGYSGTYGVSGVVCSIGTGGSFSWAGTPAAPGTGFLWFLVVATDGYGTEGPWGLNSGGVERKGPGTNGCSGYSSIGCVLTNKVQTNPCGQ